jgi:hypothetical protein
MRRGGEGDQRRGEERRGEGGRKGIGSCRYESSCIEFKCFRSGPIYLHSLSKLRKVDGLVETCRPISHRLSNLYSMCKCSKDQTKLEQTTYLVQPQSQPDPSSQPQLHPKPASPPNLTSHPISAMINLLTSNLPSKKQNIRYGLVARICRSHCSADKAGVQFPVSEIFFFAPIRTRLLVIVSWWWCGGAGQVFFFF